MNAQLRACGEIARNGDRHVAERAEQFLHADGLAVALGAFMEVRVEPGLVTARKSFDERLSKELFGTIVEVFAHAAPTGKADFNASSPR